MQNLLKECFAEEKILNKVGKFSNFDFILLVNGSLLRLTISYLQKFMNENQRICSKKKLRNFGPKLQLTLVDLVCIPGVKIISRLYSLIIFIFILIINLFKWKSSFKETGKLERGSTHVDDEDINEYWALLLEKVSSFLTRFFQNWF